MNMEPVARRMDLVERCFVKYGAVPQDIDHNRERLGKRQCYLYKGRYYRVDTAAFDGVPFLVIDDPRYASAGIMKDVNAIPVTLDDARLEQEVRYALEIEPYPENYPDW